MQCPECDLVLVSLFAVSDEAALAKHWLAVHGKHRKRWKVRQCFHCEQTFKIDTRSFIYHCEQHGGFLKMYHAYYHGVLR
jgi:hypothetical protein